MKCVAGEYCRRLLLPVTEFATSLSPARRRAHAPEKWLPRAENQDTIFVLTNTGMVACFFVFCGIV